MKDDLKEDTILISETLSDSNKFIKANNDLFEAGFIYYDTGLQPQIKMLYQAQKIFLGVNQIFSCIDYMENKKMFEAELPSLLYDVLVDLDCIYVVCVCELDIFVYQNDGTLLWNMGFRDTVESYYLDDESIIIECSDGERTTFQLDSGAVK
ncbi:hypothetical protein [Listeria seeligeri]|uniref:hypothetical protein n=1 Tax=Listeria seeligeri TaxID=1640 RepID=UPI0021AB1CCB|nr:hypothetical protein [Listeria seeligeri]